MPKFNDNVSYPNKLNPVTRDSFLMTDFDNNKRTKTLSFDALFESIADYFNNTDSPLSQNNVFRFVNLSVVIGDSTNPEPTEIEYEQILLDKINLAFQSLNLTILQTELIIFKVNAISYGTFNTREIKYFMPAPIGKGVYEPLSDFITAEELEIAYRQNATTGVTPPIVIGAPGMYVFELGDITVHGLSILDFLNTIQDTAWPNGYDLSDANTLYFFNYTLGANEYLMFFDAANSANGNGFYGDQGDFLFTSTDLVLLYDSSTPSPVVVDAVPEAPQNGKLYARKNLAWREVLLQFLSDMPSLVGNAGKVFSVNITEDGFEWVEMTGGGGGVGTIDQVLTNGNQITSDTPIEYPDNGITSTVYGNSGFSVRNDGSDQITSFFTNGLRRQKISDSTKFTELGFQTPTSGKNPLIPNEDGLLATRDWTNSQNFEKQSNKGAANGYTPLNASSKIDATYLPDSILGQVNYQGTWNASTNSPSIPIASSANKGYYYIVNVAGTTTINGINDWQIGDWIISNGTTWSKVDNTDAISSFNGRTGAITLVSSDVTSALGFTPENSDNKATTMMGNTSSNTVFLTAKAVYDWVMSLGFITDVITALGFTPANVANTTRLLKSVFTGNAVTGTETVVGTCQVGGIGLGSAFSLKCFLRSQKSNTTSQGNLKFYLNSSPDLSGSPVQIAVNASTSAIVIPLERTFIYSGGNLYGWPSTNNAPTDVANSTVAETVTTVDMTTTRYIVATLQTTGTAGSTLNGRDFKVIVEPNVS